MKKVVIDANLLVLLTVGTFERSLIGRHKRCRDFDASDFDLLIAMLAGRDVVCTPHAFAEASNLVRLIGEPLRSALTRHFGAIVRQIHERMVASRDATMMERYERLGLVDATMMLCGDDGSELLTADFDLYMATLQAGGSATNFQHVREQAAPR